MDERTKVLHNIGEIVARHLNQHEILGSVCNFQKAIEIYTDTEEYEIFEAALQDIEYEGFRIEFGYPELYFDWNVTKLYIKFYIMNDDGDKDYFNIELPSIREDGTVAEQWHPVDVEELEAPDQRAWGLQRLRDAAVYMKLAEGK